jgi:CubicO group peptidase (beta-lactamase class C family)
MRQFCGSSRLSLIACICHLCADAMPASHSPDALPRSHPEAQGVASAAILEFIKAADEQVNVMNSFMLVRHGHVVAEGWWAPYSAESRHSLFSLSKSFTSTAVGIAIAEGKMKLEDSVLAYFPADAPADPSANLKAMRAHDLLRMSAGHQNEASLPDTTELWTKVFLAHPVPFKPGTHFLYNTPATYMLSAMLQKATGVTVLDYLKPRLFEPLAIADPEWGKSPQGISLGGYGLSIRTEDIAKFGQLLLQRGKWRGRPLIPASWIDDATARQTANGSNPTSDWEQGYGYQFWRCRNGAYRGDGAFGQFCIVLPEQDAVVAITSGTKNMQRVMNLVWDKLLPALAPKPLRENKKDRERLAETLAHLALPTVASSSAMPRELLGKRFVFPTNDQKLEAIEFKPHAAAYLDELFVTVNGVEQRLSVPHQSWHKTRLAFGKLPEQPVAVTGAWTAKDRYTAKFCFYETPTIVTVNLRFSGESVDVDSEFNVAFGPTKLERLTGLRAAAP